MINIKLKNKDSISSFLATDGRFVEGFDTFEDPATSSLRSHSSICDVRHTTDPQTRSLPHISPSCWLWINS